MTNLRTMMSQGKFSNWMPGLLNLLLRRKVKLLFSVVCVSPVLVLLQEQKSAPPLGKLLFSSGLIATCGWCWVVAGLPFQKE